MNCPKCGDYNPSGTVFCGNCGCSMAEHSVDPTKGKIQYFTEGLILSGGEKYCEALDCFLKSAELGYSGAYIEVGNIYYYGKGVATDYHEALKWYQKAADELESEAYEKLAEIYHYGKGVDKDLVKATGYYNRAIEYYKNCLESSSAEQAEKLGNIYEKAPEGIRSYNMALQCYEVAASVGSENATIYEKLGLAYGKGVGRPINCEKAFTFCKKAIEYGCENGEVYFIAAELYQNGKGGERNKYFSRSYYQKAVDLGHTAAATALEQLQLKMQKEREESKAALSEIQARAAASESVLPEKEEWRRRLTRTCPRCGKHSGHPLSELGKKASIGFWGFASRKWGKSYECDCCGYMW